ncbi:MAG: ferredoxin [archaeon]
MAKVSVDKKKCIGCGACEALASDIFVLNSEGKATVKKASVDEEDLKQAKDAAENCPVDAISVK